MAFARVSVNLPPTVRNRESEVTEGYPFVSADPGRGPCLLFCGLNSPGKKRDPCSSGLMTPTHVDGLENIVK